MLLGLVACGGPSDGTSGTASTPGVSEAAVAPAVRAATAAPPEPDAHAGKPYARVRESLLADGWRPLRTPACRGNVGGEAPVCDALPETDSCSGDGHCLMRFAHPATGRTLVLRTYGDIDRWNGADAAAVLVKSSDATAVATPPADACPAAGFDAFLQHFAAMPASRGAFSAPLVLASELHSDEGGDRLVPVAYAGSDYPRFSLSHDARGFHHVDPAGRIDPAPLRVDVREDAAGAVVRYAYGSAEGRAFRFERAGDCWRLAEELPPALD
ncbi:hypothetical protein [Lysobacter humi (ex Lee et al. 2017)]